MTEQRQRLSVPAIAALTSLTMAAFAGNSLLCRIALKQTAIDAASFTTIRLISGAAVLLVLSQAKSRGGSQATSNGNWPSALALLAYAAGFSFAYISLTVATGALLLFGAVQITMIGRGFWAGERLRALQVVGLAMALGGLIGLLLPGLSAPPLIGSVLMLGTGVAWGVYSLRGKGAKDPIRVTAGNFLRSVPPAILLSLVTYQHASWDTTGVICAIASGAITSGLGYSVWYSVLPWLTATNASTVQLSVPVITSLGGVVLLGESLSLRLILATCAILGGILLVILQRRNSSVPTPASPKP